MTPREWILAILPFLESGARLIRHGLDQGHITEEDVIDLKIENEKIERYGKRSTPKPSGP